jgi:hypothetical protein
MPRGIPASGVRKQRTTRSTSRKTSTGGGRGVNSPFNPQFWNNIQKLATQMLQLHQSHGGQQTRGRGRGGRIAGTGQKRATGTRQRRAAAA